MIRSIFLRATLRPQEIGSAPAASATPAAFMSSRRVTPSLRRFFIPVREEFNTRLQPSSHALVVPYLTRSGLLPERGLSAGTPTGHPDQKNCFCAGRAE